MSSKTDCFISFGRAVDSSELPSLFNFPFFFEPHPLCVEAAKELQTYIQTQKEWEHNFGLEEGKTGLVIGKMFGVLLVQNSEGEIGYLSAFSGKLANENSHKRFVPPIFDMLAPDDFFLEGIFELNDINARVKTMEQSAEVEAAQTLFAKAKQDSEIELKALKEKIKKNKERRDLQRNDATFGLCEEGREAVLEDLRLESIREQGELKFKKQAWKTEIETRQSQLEEIKAEMEVLREERKLKSAALQQRLFDQYNFLNKEGDTKNVLDIFATTAAGKPPAGAGECAAPKLLQYAFQHQLKPLSFAEFWWGQSPVSEVRKHGHFYAACRGKCEPILAHMLQGIPMEPNPMLQGEDVKDQLETIYEDEFLIVLNKPAELLSVPGKIDQISVLSILQARFPEATGPLLIHRLDMATSGLLIAAKTKEVHQKLQSQFIKKTVRKSYIALLDGVLEQNPGSINLPLRVDLNNRPHQLVCFEHGKPALTHFEKLGVENGKTRVKLIPITGRTHQLRVHCAHQDGLNMPIIGDDLYGHKADRLYLHAHTLTIKHPNSREEMTFEAETPF